MSNHPNRGRGTSGHVPTPEEVRACRGALTQDQVAALIYTTGRTWRTYEAGEKRMHPASWELLKIKRGVE